MAEEGHMTTILVECEDGTNEEIEIPTEQYNRIMHYCTEEDITLDEYIARAVDVYAVELKFRDMLVMLESLEQKYLNSLDEIHALIKKLREVMANPDWREV